MQNRGQGGGSDAADLPKGMSNDAAKQFIERLNTDQGGNNRLHRRLIIVGTCRKCNSTHCHCETGLTPNIAPASPSPAPISPSPSPYPLAYSPNFTAGTSSQMRGQPYLNASPYVASPQFTAMPSFNNNAFRTPQSSYIAGNVVSDVASQVQNYQRRQEQLMISTQRRIQQEAEIARRQNREANGSTNSLTNTMPTQQFDSYTLRTSASINYVPPTHADNVVGNSDFRLDLPTQSYPRISISDTTPHTEPYRYFQDSSAQMTPFSYASSIANPVYRPPSFIGVGQRNTSLRSSSPIVQASAAPPESQTPQSVSDQTRQPPDSNDSQAPSQSQPLLSDLQGQEAIEAGDQHSEIQTKDPSLNLLDPELSHDDITSELFSGFEKVGMDNFDAADNEWLYALETPCARPGAVCECGDSCCCPGCFTHTNNPGDRGVYHTMLNKLGGMLSTDREESAISHNKSCMPNKDVTITTAEVKL